MGDWNADPADVRDPYAPDCGSRAAEGFYVGALYGVVWGVVGRLSSSPILPSTPTIRALKTTPVPESHPAGLWNQGATRHLRTLGRGAAGYGMAAGSTAGVFGVFVGMVNAGTCACERFRGRKDWFNNMCGGAVAGLSVALLSRHTRTPQMIAAHIAGAAAITSIVAVATGPPVGS
ncbi:unnamed protein product [Pylaiella littoralis]